MLLNLQRVVIALVNNMAIAENIAYQTINPGVSPQGTSASNG